MPSRRSSTSVSPRRSAMQLTEQDAVHRVPGSADGHAGVHVAGAGGRDRRPGRHPDRHLLARVLLYQLLTDHLPFDSQELRSGGLLDLYQRIREADRRSRAPGSPPSATPTRSRRRSARTAPHCAARCAATSTGSRCAAWRRNPPAATRPHPRSPPTCSATSTAIRSRPARPAPRTGCGSSCASAAAP